MTVRNVVRLLSALIVGGCFWSESDLRAGPPVPAAPSSGDGLFWSRLPDLPDREGFAGAFAGVSGGTLLVAGGANFPSRKPWEGGRKVWYDTVFALDAPDGAWRIAGRLPSPLGYGVSASYGGAVICVGGSGERRHGREAFRLRWTNGHLRIEPLPALPRPVANACGAILPPSAGRPSAGPPSPGPTLYVAGGIERPDASEALHTLYALDLADERARWQELPAWPGPPRMLATAAVQAGAFFLVGGADLAPGPEGKPVRRWLRDAYRYGPGQGWTRIADLPHPIVAAPSPAPPLGPAQFLILGGDDGSRAAVAPSPDHPGFSAAILAYDAAANAWTEFGRTPAPRVTLPAVLWGDRWVVPSGEIRPGVRSPQVWTLLVPRESPR